MAEQSIWQKLAARRWPQTKISGDGFLAVVLCREVQLAELPIFAMQIRRANCGHVCYGTDQHRVEELKVPVQTFKSRRWNADCEKDPR
jgi:hypothetical protein